MASEEVGRAAAARAAAVAIVGPDRTIALRTTAPVTLELDEAGKVWRILAGHFLVRPYCHFETVVATLVSSSLLQCVEKIRSEVEDSVKGGTIGHGFAL
jgi:hypothetical protein